MEFLITMGLFLIAAFFLGLTVGMLVTTYKWKNMLERTRVGRDCDA